jgi:hypothetical protein
VTRRPTRLGRQAAAPAGLPPRKPTRLGRCLLQAGLPRLGLARSAPRLGLLADSLPLGLLADSLRLGRWPLPRLGRRDFPAPRLGSLLLRPGWAGLGESGLAGISPQVSLCHIRLGRIILPRLGQVGAPLAQAGLSPCRPN